MSLRLENGGEVVGAVRSPLGSREADATGRILLAEAHDGKPPQYAKLAAGTAAAAMLNLQSRRVVSGHIGWLRSETSVQFARFFCQPLEVLAENAGYVRVRLNNGPYMLVGWTKGPLAERGNADCSTAAIASLLHPKRGTGESAPRVPLPGGHLPVESDVSGFAFQGDIFVRAERGGLCKKWTFVRDADGLSLKRRVVRIVGKGGLWESNDTLPFDQDPPSAHYLATSSGGHWMQKPQGAQTPPALPEDTGAQWPFQLVRVLPGRVEWTETRFAASYDPGLAKIWYRSEAACNAGARSSVQSTPK